MSIARDLFVAIGTLQTRSDVVVDALRRVGPQPSKTVALSAPLRALYDEVGAIYLSWRFLDAECSGELSLRAPSSQGFWDASVEPATVWQWRDGAPLGLPGEEVAILEGADEGGVLVRKNGGVAYFDSDGEATPLADDVDWLRKGIVNGFAHGWSSQRGPLAEVTQRLSQPFEARTTVEAEIIALDRLQGDEARAWRIGSWTEYQYNTVAKALKQKVAYSKTPIEERGRIALAALAEVGAVDAKLRKALLKPFGGPATLGAFEDRFLLKDNPALTRATVRLTFQLPAKDAKRFALGRPLMARVLLDAGVAFGDLDADAIRYVPGDHRELGDYLPTVTTLGKLAGTPPSVDMQVTLVDGVGSDLTLGHKWSSAALEPMTLVTS